MRSFVHTMRKIFRPCYLLVHTHVRRSHDGTCVYEIIDPFIYILVGVSYHSLEIISDSFIERADTLKPMRFYQNEFSILATNVYIYNL